MHRLAPSQPVVLDLEEEAIDCVVVEVDGDSATIAPMAAADASYIPSLGRPASLVFVALGPPGGGDRVSVRGAVRRGSVGARLSFTAGGDDRLAPRRRTARSDVAVMVELCGPEGSDEAPRRLDTSNVSLGGIGVQLGSWEPDEGALLRFALELPDAPPIRGTAHVLRVEGGVAGLAFEQIAPPDRSRLAAFLIASRAA